MAHIGLRSGRWTVIGEPFKKMYAADLGALCRCDCGTKRIVAIRRILKGYTRSCGCTGIENSKSKLTKHGQWNTRLYAVWRTMKERCSNPNHAGYLRYGGRGIVVCPRWQDFKEFYVDNKDTYQEGLMLDRVNNDGPYSPENCRWVTARVQANNRSNNVILEFNGQRLTCAEWAAKIGILEITLRKRLQAGWAVEKALTMPIRRYNHQPLLSGQ